MQALGLLHSRTNLSPFTKDFRGESQLNEPLAYFSLVRHSGIKNCMHHWVLQLNYMLATTVGFFATKRDIILI